MSSALVQHGMNEALRFGKILIQQGMVWRYEHDDILLVKPFYQIVSKNKGANWVTRLICVALKETNPVGQILLINVLGSSLARNRC